jgi:hypothetical protein
VIKRQLVDNRGYGLALEGMNVVDRTVMMWCASSMSR